MKSGDDVTEEVGAIFDGLRSIGYKNEGNIQHVVHQGLGAWGPAAIVACFCTIFLMVVVTVVLTHENDKLARRIETLEAWNGVNNNTLTKLQSTIEYMQKGK